MALEKWEKLSSEDKFKNSWWTYKLDKFRLPNGKEGEYHYLHTNGASFMVPVTDEGKIVWVKQYRYLFDKESLELPAGGLNDKTAEDTARHELIEETGYDADFEKVGEIASLNGLSDELMHIYLARNLRPSDKYQSDETEEFEIVELSPQEIDDKIKSGEIWDGMSIAAWTVAKNHL